MNIIRVLYSFKDACRGLAYAFTHEQNFRIQVFSAIVVIIGMFVFEVKVYEKIVVLLLISFVIILELLNTAIEKFLDLLKPRLHSYVQIIKDIMAAAVFVSSIVALVIGLIIFLPHLFDFFTLI